MNIFTIVLSCCTCRAIHKSSFAYASKLDRVVSTWKDACQAKDLRIQELQLDLAACSSQLERARADATSLTARVLEREQGLAAHAHELRLVRDAAEAQAQSWEARMATGKEQVCGCWSLNHRPPAYSCHALCLTAMHSRSTFQYRCSVQSHVVKLESSTGTVCAPAIDPGMTGPMASGCTT